MEELDFLVEEEVAIDFSSITPDVAEISVSEVDVFDDNIAALDLSVQAIGDGAEVYADWNVDAGDGYSSISGELTAFVA